MRIAIIGTGVSGLVCAHILGRHHDITVYEKATRPGGHTNTVDVETTEGVIAVDTGFIVFNDVGYPGLNKLFDELSIAHHDSDMSFSVSDAQSGIEWRGSTFSSIFAQRRNLLRPSFVAMLAQIIRFNRTMSAIAKNPQDETRTLEEFLNDGHYSASFRRWFLIPYGASIWSADPAAFSAMPIATLAQFLSRHALLTVSGQPQWRTVTGGARTYVDAICDPLREQGRLRLGATITSITRHLDGVSIETATRPSERFDHVILACHSDQALEILSDATPDEKEVLSAIGFQSNRAVLHHDTTMMPSNRRAWAAWNFAQPLSARAEATLTYNMNLLQGLPTAQPIFVTLNREEEINEKLIVASFDYAHPVLGGPAIVAQRRHGEISGVNRTSYCGAYWGYGFHEDGVESARRVCADLGTPW